MSESRVPEWVKNLLIAALSLSALWLLTLSPMYMGSPLQARIQALFSAGETDGAPPSVSLTAAARPTRIAVVNDDGRYGVQYDTQAVDAAFDNLGALLGEAVGTASAPFVIQEARWRQALTQPGVYFDFSGAIPFSALSGWLRGGEVNTALTANARRMVLSFGDGENDVWLFWLDEDTGHFYACSTPLDRTLHLLPNLASWLPNAAFFAFEDPDYADCYPYTLITSTPSPAVYSASTPLSAENDANAGQVLAALNYAAAAGSSYATSEGTRYTDGNNTFLLTNSGTLRYHAADPVQPASADAEAPTTAQLIEVTRKLAADTLGLLCGDARIYLISAQADGDSLSITYGYSLNGAAVSLYDEGWAARFTIEKGALSGFTLHFRSYTATASSTLLLPELQAVAALNALNARGGELLLSYRDTGGDSVTAGWIAS